MASGKARIPPISDVEATEEQKNLFGEYSVRGRVLNVHRTLVRVPELMAALLKWVRYLQGISITPREREILILRTLYLCRSAYEWPLHLGQAKRLGLGDDEIRWLKEGSDASGVPDEDRTLFRLAEELVTTHGLSDELWSKLSARWSERQCMEAVFLVGEYIAVATAWNAFRTPLEEGTALEDDVRCAFGL